MWWNDFKEIKEWMVTIAARITELDMKMLENQDQIEKLVEVELSIKTLDKFQDYMKNLDKLNSMINEFKGCVSMARASLDEKKELEELRTILKNMLMSCDKYYNYQKSTHDQFFKIDAIYKAFCDKEVKKPKKKVNPRKKSPTVLSS